MIVEIELVGGPADGVRVHIEGDPMNPPKTYEVLEQAGPDAPVQPRALTYRRAVNPLDDGPAWHYRYEDPLEQP